MPAPTDTFLQQIAQSFTGWGTSNTITVLLIFTSLVGLAILILVVMESDGREREQRSLHDTERRHSRGRRK